MKRIKTLFNWIFLLAIISVSLSAGRPYLDRYWIQEKMKVAASYGTKNSIEKTTTFLDKTMREAGYRFNGEDFVIEKDEASNVTIKLAYQDEIAVLGLKLKDLRFEVQASEKNVAPML